MDYPLKKGSKNDTVKDLQSRLNKLGAGLNPDGDFGDKTEVALFKYTVKKIVNNQSELNAIGVNASAGNNGGVDYNKIQSKVPAEIFPHLVEAMRFYQINTALRVSHSISQFMHESGNFKFVKENLNYGVDGLRKTFPKYFPNDLVAKEYERQPEKIANRVYANRMGNGDEKSGDGWKFSGKGYIQLTGRANVILFGKSIGEDLTKNPDLIATPKYASLSACWFFSSNGLNAIADKGATDDVVKEITKKINGGVNGLQDRQVKFREIYSLFK